MYKYMVPIVRQPNIGQDKRRTGQTYDRKIQDRIKVGKDKRPSK